MIARIVSGGQTGVDQAALIVARELGISTGGFAPRGWLTEAGPMEAVLRAYGLLEHQGEYAARTRANIAEADHTLVLLWGVPTGGTKLTLGLCRQKAAGDGWLGIDLQESPGSKTLAEKADFVRTWLKWNNVKVLNVAGPRESKHPGIGVKATAFLRAVLVEGGTP